VVQDYWVWYLECLVVSLAQMVSAVMEFKEFLVGLMEVSMELVTRVVVRVRASTVDREVA
jgi:hypothetical protein